MRSARIISVASTVAILVAPSTALAQQFATTYTGTPMITGTAPSIAGSRFPLLVGPGGNHALPCSLFGSAFMRRVPTSYCLSDAELAEERVRVRSIIGNPLPPSAVARQQKLTNSQAMVPPPAGRRVVAAPLRSETRKLFRLEPGSGQRSAGAPMRGAQTTRASLPTSRTASPGNRGAVAAYRVGSLPRSGVASGTPAPRPAVAGTPDGKAGGRAQRIP